MSDRPARRWVALALVLALTALSCSNDDQSDAAASADNTAPGAESPEAAVTGLLSALQAGEYAQAVGFGMPEQLPVIALAEGAPPEQIRGLLASRDASVGANFWRSFAEGLQSFVGVSPDEIRIETVDQFEAGGQSFARVRVGFPNDPNVRSFVTQEGNGWYVDVLATFAAGLAGRIEAAASNLRTDPENGDIMEHLAGQRPSLEAALADPEISPQLDQDVRAALVAISE